MTEYPVVTQKDVDYLLVCVAHDRELLREAHVESVQVALEDSWRIVAKGGGGTRNEFPYE